MDVTITGSYDDVTSPTLSSSAPSDNATSVAVGSDIVLMFSEAVKAGTGNIIISNGTDSRTIDIADTQGQVTISGSTVTINPTNNLASGSTYNVQLPTGVIKDLAGNAYAGISDATTLNFMTAGIPITTVTTISLSNDTGASSTDFITNTAAQTISGSLSAATVAGEVVKISLNNGATWVTAANTTGQSSFSLSGVTLTASDTLKARVEDANGNAAPTASRTYVLDTVAPTVTSVTDSTVSAVTRNPVIFTVTFSEALASGVEPGSFTASNGTVTGVSRVSGSVYNVTVSPSAGVASGNMVLNLGGSVELKDIAGNVVSAVIGIGEQGIDTFAPATTVSSVSLSSDTGVSSTDFITSAAAQTIHGMLSAATVAGEVVRVSLNNGSTWTTAANTAGSNSFTLSDVTLVGANTLKVRVEDAVSNAGATWSHSFRLDTVAPSVSSVTDATPESVTKNPITFTVTFNEAIVGTVGSNNFTATNGIVSGFSKVSDTVYTVVVTPNPGVASGNSVALSLVGTGLTDTAGNSVLNADLGGKDSQGIDTQGSNRVYLTETNAVLTASGTVMSASQFIPQSNAVGSNGYGRFTITADGAWSYATDTPHNEFVAGNNYTDTLTVTADGTSQIITVIIAGTNDAALITGTSTASLTEMDVVLSVTGTLAVTDPDSSALFVAQNDVAGLYGKLSITEDGVWNYTTDTAHNEFALGTNYTDTIAVATVDGTTKLVTVIIAGSNDAAVIAGTSTANLTETNAVLTASGTLTVEDVDNASTFVARSGVAGSNGFGHFSITTSGVWTYTTDSAHNEFVSAATYIDSFTVTAKDGTPQVVTVTITGSNDAVVITGTEPAVTAFSTQTPVKVSSLIGINDPDGDAGWNGGSLQVKISAHADASDSLFLPTLNSGGSGIWVDGTTLNAGSLSIGTVSAASVSSSTPLTITFNANATNALVQEVARALSFNNSSATPGALDRTVSFIATDALNLSTTAVQTITVNAPTLTTFDVALASVNEDTQAEITLSSLLTHGNEEAVGGATIDAFVVKAVSSGSLKIGSSAAIATDWVAGSNATVDDLHHAYWTPAANANGSLLNAFTMVAKDSSGRESANAVQACVEVTAVNDLPTTTNNSVTTNEDTIKILSLTDFGAYVDVEGIPMASVKITALESAGALQYHNGSTWNDVLLNQEITATDISAGKLRFEPVPNTNGNGYATISFRVSDGTEYSTGAYTLTFNVTPVNDAPTFTAFGAPVDSVNEDTTVQITLAELKAQGNEADVDGTVDAFVIRAVSSGSLRIGSSAAAATDYNASYNKTVDATHHAYWTPAVNANGSLNAFTVVARDNNGAESATAIHAVVTVTPVNDLPVISSPLPLTAFTTLNPVNVSSGMLVNDPDGDASWLSGHLQVQITTHASVDDILKLPITSSDGIWLDTNGYKLMAGATWIGTASAVSVSSGALWDFTFNSNATNALVQSVAQAVIFTNSSNAPGTSDRLVTFTVTDNVGESSSVRQMVTVNAPTLTAFDGAVVQVNEDTQVEITHADLSAKGDEADVDGNVDAFVVKSVSSGSLLIGSAVDVATAWVAGSNDTVDLTHHAWWTGAQNANGILNAFTVVARDNYASESNPVVQVKVDVTAVNDAPNTTDATVTTQEDISKVLTLSNFGIYTDVEGSLIASVQITALPSAGLLRYYDGSDWRDVSLNQEISATEIDTGKLRFDPSPNANGESYGNATNNAYSTFDFKVSDGTDYSVSASTLTINVTPVNDPPTFTRFASAVESTDKDMQVEITLAELQAKGDEADIDGTVDAFTIKAVSSGTLKIGTSAFSATAYNAATNNRVDATHHAYWTGAQSATGTLNAFTVVAKDNSGGESATPVQVTVEVLPANYVLAGSGAEDTLVEVTSATLHAQVGSGGAASFVITDVVSGHLRIGSSAVTATAFDATSNNLVDATHNAYWIGEQNANGLLNAFTMDGDIQARITVSPVNDLPISTSDSVTTPEDTAKVLSVIDFGLYIDVENPALAKVQITALASAGALQYNSNGAEWGSVALNQVIAAADINAGKLRFAPAANANGDGYATIGYRVSDGTDYSASAYTLAVNVTPVNDPPTLTTFTAPVQSVVEDTTVEITLADLLQKGDEVDIDGTVTAFVIKALSTGTLRIGVSAESAAAYGSLLGYTNNNYYYPIYNNTVDASHNAYWTPAANANGTLNAFTAVARDNNGAESVAPIQATVAVTAVNDLPVVFSSHTVTAFTTPTPVSVSNLVIINDSDGDASWNGGSLQVQITANAGVADSLTLPVVNPGDSGIWLDTANNRLMAGLVVIGDASASSVSNDTAWHFTFNAHATNSLVQALGRALLFSNGSDLPDTAPRSITFTVEDNYPGTIPTTMVQTVTVNAPAEAIFTINEDSVLGLTDFASYANIEGSTLAKIRITELPHDGALQYSSNGSDWTLVTAQQEISAAALVAGRLRFEPALNGYGSNYATIGYQVNDGITYSSNCILTVHVTAVNDAPTLSAFATVDTTTEDTPVVITFAGLLAQGDVQDVDGTVDAFIIKGVSTGTLKIGSSAESAQVYGAVIGFVGNNINASIYNTTVDASHHVYWTPAANANGTLDAFTAVAKDNSGVESSTPVQAKVMVSAVNDLPQLSSPDSVTAFMTQTPATPVSISNLIVINDPDGDASWNGGVLQVQITANAEVADILTLPVVNPGGSGIWLDATNNKVMAGFVVIGDANTSFVNNDAAWQFTFNSNATNALVQALGRSLMFSNGSDTPGTAPRSITFTASDNYQGSTPSLMEQTVTVNAPTLTTFDGAIENGVEDTPVEITLAKLLAHGDEADVDGAVLAFVVKGVSSGSLRIGDSEGTATAWVAGSHDTVDATHHAWWTGAQDANGLLNAFTLAAKDNSGSLSNRAVQAVVSVTPVNDLPTTTNSSVTTNEDTAVALRDFGFYADKEHSALAKVKITELPSAGQLRYSSDGGDWAPVTAGQEISAEDILAGRLRFEPALNANGSAYTTVGYKVSDGTDYSASAYTLTLNVTAVNDAPTFTFLSGVVASTLEVTPVQITVQDIKAQGDEADVDGTVDAFVVKGLSSGTLRIGLDASSATAYDAAANNTIDNTYHAYWSAEGNAVGIQDAFTVVARDNSGVESSTAIQATVTVTPLNQPPDVDIVDVTGSVTELATPVGNLTDSGTIGFTDVDLTDSHTVSAVTASAGALGTLTPTITTDTTGSGLGGIVTWNYSVDASVVEYLAEGEHKVETFTFSVLDNNGGSVDRTVDVSITGTNDTPVIGEGIFTGSVTEMLDTATGEKPTILLLASNSFAISDVDLTDTQTVTAVAAGTGYLGTFTPTVIDQTTTDGTVTIGWDFTVTDSPLDYLAAGQTLTQTYAVTVTDTAGATATKDVVITINGTNDAPVVDATDVTGTITEMVTPVGNLTDSGTIGFTDVDLTDSHTVSAVTASAGALGTLTPTITTDTTGSGLGGIVTWNYSVDASVVEYLAEGEHKVETFTFSVLDNNGGSVERTVDVTITGTNDAPVAVADSGTTAEHVVLTVYAANGVLKNDTDPDSHDTHHVSAVNADVASVASVVSGTNGGTFTVFADGSYVFNPGTAFDSLLVDESQTTSVTCMNTDNNGLSSSAILTVTVTGANHAPTIIPDLTTATGAITEATLTTGSAAAHTVAGSIAFADVDLSDTHGISVTDHTFVWTGGTLSSAQNNELLNAFTLGTEVDSTETGTGTQQWHFSAADSTFDFLAAGEQLTASYQVTVNDNTGGTVTKDVVVTITGANDVPVASDVPHGVTEGHIISVGLLDDVTDVDKDTLSINGSVTYEVIDDKEVHHYQNSVAGVSLVGNTLTVDASNAAYTYLTESEIVSIIAHYKVSDGLNELGNVSIGHTEIDQTQTVTITGQTYSMTGNVDFWKSHDASSTVGAGLGGVDVTLHYAANNGLIELQNIAFSQTGSTMHATCEVYKLASLTQSGVDNFTFDFSTPGTSTWTSSLGSNWITDFNSSVSGNDFTLLVAGYNTSGFTNPIIPHTGLVADRVLLGTLETSYDVVDDGRIGLNYCELGVLGTTAAIYGDFTVKTKQATTNSDGSFSFDGLELGNYTLTAAPALTGNPAIAPHSITASDAFLAARMVAGYDSLTGYELFAADINADGAIDSNDTTAIINMALHTMDPSWVFVDSTAATLVNIGTEVAPKNIVNWAATSISINLQYDLTGDDALQLIGVISGDVNGNGHV